MNKEAAEILATALEKDAADHDAGEYKNIGLRWDDIYAELLPIEEDIDAPIYGIAFRFWDDWCDASSHDWRYHEPITKEKWPLFARELAQCLRRGTMPANQLILESFTPKPRAGMLERLRQWF